MTDILLIILIQLIYVPLLTLRTICMVKKLRILTTILGVLECLVYVFGLSIVLSGDKSLIEMLVYSLGFGAGLYVGIIVEDKLALGFTSMIVNINHKNEEMIKALRENGFGVTVITGEGKDSIRYRLDILTKRSREKDLIKIINYYEPFAFITTYEPTQLQGGYLTKIMRKNKRKGRNEKVIAQILHKPQKKSSWYKWPLKKVLAEFKQLNIRKKK